MRMAKFKSSGVQNQNLNFRISYLLNIVLLCIVIFLVFQKKCDDYGEFPPETQKPYFIENRQNSEISTTRSKNKPGEVLYDMDVNVNVRLLCMVLTTPKNYKKKAVHVQATWGRKCNTLVFLSDTSRVLKKPENLQVIELVGTRGREKLWEKVKRGMVSVAQSYNGTFDFLLKADDDTYVVVDNLRNLISRMDPSEEFIFGHKQNDQGVSYLSGGSGYVMSSSAFNHIVTDGFRKDGPQQCILPHAEGDEVKVYPNEDLQMGKCAQLLNINLYNSEINGQSTFFPFKFEQHLVKSLAVGWWLNRTEECLGVRKSRWEDPASSPKCVSPYVTSMHYVKPHMMYVLQFLTEVFRNDQRCSSYY